MARRQGKVGRTSIAALRAQERGEHVPAKQIVMYARPGCEDSDAAREFLKRHDLSIEEVNIDENEVALKLVMSVNEGKRRTPTFEVDCRVFHCSPFDPVKLARELGLPDAGSETSAHQSHSWTDGRSQ
ncbi:MAG TPA: glutaredoxin family protein [Candidatus Dormibacteraeota bacterium]|nr:glutaredoxin family protein [Candidatus Dormibacteraeota bacterium]